MSLRLSEGQYVLPMAGQPYSPSKALALPGQVALKLLKNFSGGHSVPPVNRSAVFFARAMPGFITGPPATLPDTPGLAPPIPSAGHLGLPRSGCHQSFPLTLSTMPTLRSAHPWPAR